MKTNGNDKTLESYKIFPIVAWALVIGFSFFVYNIALRLQTVASDLEAQTKWLQEQASMPASEIKDFDRPSTTHKTTF